MADSILPDADEFLATGWEPQTPATDTLLRRAIEVHASWATAVGQALGRPARHADRWAGAYVAERGALTNPVVLTQPLLELSEFTEVLVEVGEVVPESVPYFLLSPFPAPDLAALGLVKVGHPPLMVRLPGGAPPPLKPGVTLREVDDAAGLAVAERVLIEGYPMPELQPVVPGAFFAPAILDGVTRVWTAYVDDVPAATAAAHVAGDAVLVEYVAALQSARGRGAASAATWAAAVCSPGLPALLLASDDGRPVYERMGFHALTRWTAWVRPA